MEQLERRTLLAASLSNGVLSIVGTDGTDLVTYGIGSKAGRIYIDLNGARTDYALSNVARIDVSLGGGGDLLQTYPFGKPVSANLGAGADDRIEITGTASNDSIGVSANRVTVGSHAYDYDAGCENVFVFGAGGDADTMALSAAAGIGTANIHFQTGSGFDVLDATSDWAGDIHFTSGDGGDHLIARAKTNFDYDSGDGLDSLTTYTTAHADHLTVHDDYYLGLYVESQFIRDINFTGVHELRIEPDPAAPATGSGQVHTISLSVRRYSGVNVTVVGGGDAEHVYVRSHPAFETGTSLNFDGNGGDDRLELAEDAYLLANFNGGAGFDGLAFAGTSGDDTIRADLDNVTTGLTPSDGKSNVNYTGVEHAVVAGEGGSDTFYVNASAATAFNVLGPRFGGNDPLDALHLGHGGGNSTSINWTNGYSAGYMTFSDRQTITWSGMDSVSRPIVRPFADAGGPYEVMEGKSIVLDASASKPYEGSITKYEWDFDYDGTNFNVDATGVKPTFSAAGKRYPLTLTVAVRVTDGAGASYASIDTATLTLKPTAAPIAEANGPYEMYVNGSITLSSANSRDPDGYIARYEWDLDYDGVTFNVDSTLASPTTGAGGRPAGDVRTVALRVIDDIGAVSSIDTATVTLKSSAPPTVTTTGPYTSVEMGSIAMRANATAGAGDFIFRYEWDFDYDGVNFTVDSAAGAQPTYDHSWDGPSTRNVAVRVITNQGQTAIAATIVQVTNVAPTVTFSGGASVDEGSPHTITLGASGDPGPDAISSWRIDWGDGTVDVLPGNPTTATHTYDDGPAGRLISASVSDEDGTYAAVGAATVDPSFGSNGLGYIAPNLGSTDVVKKLLVTGDGKILAVGTGTTSIQLARFHPNGSTDTSFGSAGKAVFNTQYSTSVFDARLQPDGKILVAGGTANGTGTTTFTVLRYTANGALDTSFANGGVYKREFTGGSSQAVRLHVSSDGRILIGGHVPATWHNPDGTSTEYNPTFTFLRLLPNGTPDNTFGGGDGLVDDMFFADGRPALSSLLMDFRVRADGSIAAVGSRHRSGGATPDLAVATYAADGAFQGVQYRTAHPGSTSIVFATARFASDDEFYVAAEYNGPIARYRVSDATVRVSNLLSGEDPADLLPQADGSLLVAGKYSTSQMLARFKPDGTRDMTFGTNGRVTPATGATSGVYAALQPNDLHVLIGGTGVSSADFVIGRVRLGGGVYVNNVAPIVNVVTPATARVDEPVTIFFGRTDPGADTVSSWTINWADGTTDVLPGTATSATHTYARPAMFNLVVTATDEDGAFQAPTPRVPVQPDWRIDNRVLTLTGGSGNDSASLNIDSAQQLQVAWGGVTFAIAAADFDSIVVEGGAGSDSLTLDHSVNKPITFNGGSGDTRDGVVFRGSDAAETVTIGASSVVMDAEGTANDRSLTFSGLENVSVYTFNGDDDFTIDTGAVPTGYTLQAGEGNNSFEIITAPAGADPKSPGHPNETSGLRIFGGYGHDSAVVRPGAGGGIFFSAGGWTAPSSGLRDTLTFQTGDADDLVTVGSSFGNNAITGGGSVASFSLIQALVVETGGGNDRVDITRLPSGVATRIDAGAGADAFNLITTASTAAQTNTFLVWTDRVQWASNTFAYSQFESAAMTGTSASETVHLNQVPTIPLALNWNGGSDALFVNNGTYVFPAADATPAAATTGLSVTVRPGGTVLFDGSRRIAGLTLDGGSAALTAGGKSVLVTRALSIINGGSLDLADNDLVIDYAGSTSPLGAWQDGTDQGVIRDLRLGRNGGTWDGPGLRTSAAVGSRTSLGVSEASAALGLAPDQTALWNGQQVDATSVLVKFTHTGDANLDGRINGDDYFAIDAHVASANPWGWWRGDIDYNGKINGDDYWLIDSTIGQATELL
ncbi:MAG TPA: PKD domain-containing protein [Tepidisphaeraceae bacterium]|nr:PKD domain-containing protein [Tepidisphaeraceae bacterium]